MSRPEILRYGALQITIRHGKVILIALYFRRDGLESIPSLVELHPLSPETDTREFQNILDAHGLAAIEDQSLTYGSQVGLIVGDANVVAIFDGDKLSSIQKAALSG